MALKLPTRFPIFAPAILSPNPAPTHHRSPMEVRFARWNNANAEKFNERRRNLQEIEDNIRRERRFDSADRIGRYYDPDSPSAGAGESFKSTGTPSFPSNPSIPGKKSKYSRNPNPNPNSHPAFRAARRGQRTPIRVTERPAVIDRKADVRVGEDGVSYVIDGAPFEFKYSYTETPKVKPVKLRETPYAPFGPTTMERPWTGRAPLPESKKRLKEFDSFRLPPPHKKGVKPVQAPGPFLPGSGPKYVMSREEIMGEPLTEEEVKELVEGCKRTKRQMNLGRDGLTHNMLDNIHAHWKRRRVCKIKCKGVCTVDMENVRQQLEERTGGKIIYSKGGVIFLFRGRNYNYRSRPRFPLMLWKPVTPVYPRLVKQVPEGLTLEEVSQMRRKGHQLQPICKLGKNGFYNDLIKLVREAFEECELVRINCQGMNGSDYRKIGAKLKDLVPCVLLSFAYEHILIWRGQDWKSALPALDPVSEDAKESEINDATSTTLSPEGQEVTAPLITVENGSPEVGFASTRDVMTEITKTQNLSATQSPVKGDTVSDGSIFINVWPESEPVSSKTDIGSENMRSGDGISTESSVVNSDSVEEDLPTNEDPIEACQEVDKPAKLTSQCTEGVLSLLKQAIESGSAIVLEDSDLESDVIYQKSVDFSKSAPPGPVFRHGLRKIRVNVTEAQGNEKQDSEDLEPNSIKSPYVRDRGEKSVTKSKTTSKSKKTDFGEHLEILVPQGSLRVDELAKLLA